MRILFTYILLLYVAFSAVAQINVHGKIIEKETGEPIIGASVIIKGTDGKIKKFTSSKADGYFSLNMPSTEGCTLEVSMMSFEKQSFPLVDASYPLTVKLEPGSIQLKEVAVKADRIREQGDTITYHVGSFAQTQDRSIGDVLKRMPGIDVAKNGKIQYQGEDINKFYIEGSDLLGGKYGIATNGINHEDVGAVEVMENHQPMQVLAGISFSEKAALNLKLKNKAKATWTFHGDVASGYSWQPKGALWNADILAMAVMPDFQNITTLKTNNIGENLSVHTTDFFSSGHGTAIGRYVSLSLPGVPNLNSKRTLFNRSAIFSTNNLWKMGRGEFKMQLDYGFNHISAQTKNITTYFLENGNRIISEDRDGSDKSHSIVANFIYELNQRTAFINNTISSNVSWDNISLGMTGTLPNFQKASFPNLYVNNDFKLIKRFKGNHLITFVSNNEWESKPQNLSVWNKASASSFHENDNLRSRQHVSDHAFFTHESVAYAIALKGISISFEAGLKGYLRGMDSQLSGMTDLMPYIESVFGFENIINTNYITIYASPKFEYWIKRINFTLNTPLSYAYYSFDKAFANRNEGYFSPSLSINWKPNNRLTLGMRAGSGRSPMRLNLIHPSLIMTGYRSFSMGVDDFYTSSSQSLSGNLAYKHTRKGIFANARVMQSWSHLPFTSAQTLVGDYIIYSYSPAKSNDKSFMAVGSIGKSLNFLHGSANLRGNYNRSESNLLSENRHVSSISNLWSVGFKINGAPLKWLSFDYNIDFSSNQLSMNANKASRLGNLQNELLFDFIPHDKWEWHVSGEHYHNEITDNNYKDIFLLDTKIIFKPSKRIELSIKMNNILNQQKYNYTTFNQLSSFESQRNLRGRELLFTLSLKN